ncbi:NB-ARC domains-containing protein, partial [Tanacetum coccineum]
IHTGIGKHSLECGLNFPLSNASHEEIQLHSSSMCSNPDIIKLLQFPWSFSNLVEVNGILHTNLLKSSSIFRCNELINLQNLEKLHIEKWRKLRRSPSQEVKEIFEVVDLENDDVNKKQSVVVFPKLKEVTLEELDSMRYIWKSSRWITLNFPNLTKVLIDGCELLEHVFTCCMVRSLSQLHELEISRCRNMEVIVKKAEDSDTRATDVVVFRFLKSVKLDFLPNLKGTEDPTSFIKAKQQEVRDLCQITPEIWIEVMRKRANVIMDKDCNTKGANVRDFGGFPEYKVCSLLIA